jgi:hypothetical protein
MSCRVPCVPHPVRPSPGPSGAGTTRKSHTHHQPRDAAEGSPLKQSHIRYNLIFMLK